MLVHHERIAFMHLTVVRRQKLLQQVLWNK